MIFYQYLRENIPFTVLVQIGRVRSHVQSKRDNLITIIAGHEYIAKWHVISHGHETVPIQRAVTATSRVNDEPKSETLSTKLQRLKIAKCVGTRFFLQGQNYQ